jgi:hypothetical protein
LLEFRRDLNAEGCEKQDNASPCGFLFKSVHVGLVVVRLN